MSSGTTTLPRDLTPLTRIPAHLGARRTRRRTGFLRATCDRGWLTKTVCIFVAFRFPSRSWFAKRKRDEGGACPTGVNAGSRSYPPITTLHPRATKAHSLCDSPSARFAALVSQRSSDSVQDLCHS